MKLDMSVTTSFHDYGKAVSIELPPEALGARELPTDQ